MQPLIAAMAKVRQAFYATIIRSLLRSKLLLQSLLNIWISPSILGKQDVVDDCHASEGRSNVDDFLAGVADLFRLSMEEEKLIALSEGLKTQMVASMGNNPLCMLPSFNHQLPSGEECGTFLALDVGGSTFRVALVELSGRQAKGQECKILTRATFKINNAVRQLEGVMFFDWMAEKIETTLAGELKVHNKSAVPISMGLAWSFPIE